MLGVVLAILAAEVASLVVVGQWLGVGWTLLALVGSIVIGVAVMSGRGGGTVRAAMAAVTQQESPAPALVDGVIMAIAAMLFITPGFASDVVALVALVPPVRRRLCDRFLARARAHIEARLAVSPRDAAGASDGVIDVEGVEVRRDDADPRPRLPGA